MMPVGGGGGAAALGAGLSPMVAAPAVPADSATRAQAAAEASTPAERTEVRMGCLALCSNKLAYRGTRGVVLLGELVRQRYWDGQGVTFTMRLSASLIIGPGGR